MGKRIFKATRRLTLKEPYRLYRCVPKMEPIRGDLFTRARPGRSNEPPVKGVPDEWVDAWVKGLPGSKAIVIDFLLGCKPEGRSQFSFYTGGFDKLTDRIARPSNNDWTPVTQTDRTAYSNNRRSTPRWLVASETLS